VMVAAHSKLPYSCKPSFCVSAGNVAPKSLAVALMALIW
jgi:hypothetical protein